MLITRRPTLLLLAVALLAQSVLPGCASRGADPGPAPGAGPYAPETMAHHVAANPTLVAAEDSMAENLTPTSAENRARLADAVSLLIPAEDPGSPVGSLFPGYYLLVERGEGGGLMRINVLSRDLAEFESHYYANAGPLWEAMREALPVSPEESGPFGRFLIAERLAVTGMGLDLAYEKGSWRIPYLVRLMRRAVPLEAAPADRGEPLLTLAFGTGESTTTVSAYRDCLELDGTYYHYDDIGRTLASSISAG